MDILITQTFKKKLKLLEKIIVKCIESNYKLCMHIETVSNCVRNMIVIDNYEINDEYLSISQGNFELHINFNKNTEITLSKNMDMFYIKQNDSNIFFDILSDMH